MALRTCDDCAIPFRQDCYGISLRPVIRAGRSDCNWAWYLGRVGDLCAGDFRQRDEAEGDWPRVSPVPLVAQRRQRSLRDLWSSAARRDSLAGTRRAPDDGPPTV